VYLCVLSLSCVFVRITVSVKATVGRTFHVCFEYAYRIRKHVLISPHIEFRDLNSAKKCLRIVETLTAQKESTSDDTNKCYAIYTNAHTLTQLYAHKHVKSAEKSLRIVETLIAQKEKMNDDTNK
jgi:hypothetical protein